MSCKRRARATPSPRPMQIFARRSNLLPLALGLGGVAGIVVVIVGAWYYFSPQFTQVGYSPRQPVPYSHRLHVRELGIDCRYCHSNVERSSVANLPTTQTCMNCHQLVKGASPVLASIRESWETGKRMEWVRVHELPDYAYFNHGVHVTAGVGCAECHGRVDEMDQVKQVQPLSMSWCLDCHRDVRARQGASVHVRPVTEITTMDYRPNPNQPLVLPRPLDPPENCSACHR
jgi:hypothetical protein